MLKKASIGLLAGIVSGLFSTGGGMILVPAFIYLLEMEDTKSRGTSVFCILPMVITSSFFYYKGHYINWETSILWSKTFKKVARKNTKNSIYNFLNICIIQNVNNIKPILKVRKEYQNDRNTNRCNIRNSKWYRHAVVEQY